MGFLGPGGSPHPEPPDWLGVGITVPQPELAAMLEQESWLFPAGSGMDGGPGLAFGWGPVEGMLDEDEPQTSVPASLLFPERAASSVSQAVCCRTGVCPQPVLQSTLGSRSWAGTTGIGSFLAERSLDDCMSWLSTLPSLTGVAPPWPQPPSCSCEGEPTTSQPFSLLGGLPQSPLLGCPHPPVPPPPPAAAEPPP